MERLSECEQSDIAKPTSIYPQLFVANAPKAVLLWRQTCRVNRSNHTALAECGSRLVSVNACLWLSSCTKCHGEESPRAVYVRTHTYCCAVAFICPSTFKSILFCCKTASCCTSFVFTSNSPSFVQTCVKIFKFTGFYILLNNFSRHWCTTCFDQCGDHQVLRKLLLETAPLPSMNTIPKYTLIYVSMCCLYVCNIRLLFVFVLLCGGVQIN